MLTPMEDGMTSCLVDDAADSDGQTNLDQGCQPPTAPSPCQFTSTPFLPEAARPITDSTCSRRTFSFEPNSPPPDRTSREVEHDEVVQRRQPLANGLNQSEHKDRPISTVSADTG